MDSIFRWISIVPQADKRTRDNKLKKDLQDFERTNSQLVSEEERQFQYYSKDIIDTAKEAGRNTALLQRAAREGIGGGLGPIFGGVRPSYLVQDDTGVQMPSYVGPASQDIKELNEITDIQRAKKRLGFTWWRRVIWILRVWDFGSWKLLNYKTEVCFNKFHQCGHVS